MFVHRSYTCRIDANHGKVDFIKSTLLTMQALSEYVFSLGKERWADQKALYAECREKFPTLNSKHLQMFLMEYKPAGKRKAPKDHAIPAAIFLEHQRSSLEFSKETTYTNWWLRFQRKNFPLRGKKVLERMKASGGTPVAFRITERNGKIWVKISVKTEVPDPNPDPNKSVGLDVNSTCLATSENKIYSTKKMLHVKREHRKNKMKHRNLGNFTKDFTHKLTTKIANDLVSSGQDVLVLEDLTGLRRSSSKKLGTSKGKGINHTINSLPFHMVRNFLEYKCSLRGIKVVIVDPSYTSSTCNRCGSTNTDRPRRDTFVCLECDHQIHADLNAARNIRKMYTSTNGPIVTAAQVSVMT